jgi:hypothetical protein
VLKRWPGSNNPGHLKYNNACNKYCYIDDAKGIIVTTQLQQLGVVAWL